MRGPAHRGPRGLRAAWAAPRSPTPTAPTPSAGPAACFQADLKHAPTAHGGAQPGKGGALRSLPVRRVGISDTPTEHRKDAGTRAEPRTRRFVLPCRAGDAKAAAPTSGPHASPPLLRNRARPRGGLPDCRPEGPRRHGLASAVPACRPRARGPFQGEGEPGERREAGAACRSLTGQGSCRIRLGRGQHGPWLLGGAGAGTGNRAAKAVGVRITRAGPWGAVTRGVQLLGREVEWT